MGNRKMVLFPIHHITWFETISYMNNVCIKEEGMPCTGDAWHGKGQGRVILLCFEHCQ